MGRSGGGWLGTPPSYGRFLRLELKVISIVTSIHCCSGLFFFFKYIIIIRIFVFFYLSISICGPGTTPKRETIKLSNPPTNGNLTTFHVPKRWSFWMPYKLEKEKKKIEEGKYVEEIKKKPFFKIHNFWIFLSCVTIIIRLIYLNDVWLTID